MFSATTADWINGEVWVESDFDSDGDGKKDRMHADYTLPKETSTDGLKVPVVYEDSPYYANTAPNYSNWNVAHELGATPPDRPFAPFWASRNTSPSISTIYESTWLPRGFAVVHSESPGTGYSDGCPTSGGRNETLGATTVIDWLNGRRKAYTTRAGDVEAAPVNWHNGHTAMMGTSYNGTIPIAAATTGVQGLDAIVPISAITDWYDYYRANGKVRAPHSAGRRHRQQLLPRRGPRRARRRRLLPPRRGQPARPRHLPSADEADRHRRGPPVRQPQRGLGRAQLHEGRQERPRRGADRPRQQRLQRHDQERRAVPGGAQGPGRRRTSSTSTRAATAAPRRTR